MFGLRSLGQASRLNASTPSIAPSRHYATQGKAPVRVSVTGASGQIGYALLFRIASGEMLGKDQPVILQLLELPDAMKKLDGVHMELQDCSFPLLRGVVKTSDAREAFQDTNFALLVGSRPRGPGMERADLMKANAAIFKDQGAALSETANKDVKVIVVGNPANTNAMILSHFAPKINPRNITAMTRLDHNRGLGMLADKTGSLVTDIDQFCIWGNHSSTQFPDIANASIKGKALSSMVDAPWVTDTFIPAVQKRGAAIIAARGSSSAASAASAAIDHMRDWAAPNGTDGKWTSMAVYSDGTEGYGITKGLWYSFPVTCKGGDFQVVKGVNTPAESKKRMEITMKELEEEKQLGLSGL